MVSLVTTSLRFSVVKNLSASGFPFDFASAEAEVKCVGPSSLEVDLGSREQEEKGYQLALIPA